MRCTYQPVASGSQNRPSRPWVCGRLGEPSPHWDEMITTADRTARPLTEFGQYPVGLVGEDLPELTAEGATVNGLVEVSQILDCGASVRRWP